ncbi:MAG TPA: hypothetical protein VJN29_08970, partial [Intrasporangium sp.]|uniref:hypothetical protein n=1 Tax=Intrasporangium sp. TaxID=1925024 RepID=UPI002B46A90D
MGDECDHLELAGREDVQGRRVFAPLTMHLYRRRARSPGGAALADGNVRIEVLGPPGPVLDKALENNRANGVQVTVAERGL